jgi:hypothetical protein
MGPSAAATSSCRAPCAAPSACDETVCLTDSRSCAFAGAARRGGGGEHWDLRCRESDCNDRPASLSRGAGGVLRRRVPLAARMLQLQSFPAPRLLAYQSTQLPHLLILILLLLPPPPAPPQQLLLLRLLPLQ